MIEIEKPRIRVEDVSEDGTYGKFVVEPLERGFGNTLGNSLRRILLSSLPGVAAKSIKIDGVLHEFSTIPGVKEDVTEIILNVKNILAKLYCDEEKTVRLYAKGPCDVTCKHIEHDSDVEIINPDCHIASLGPDAELYMEIVLDKGRGYVSADKNKLSLKNNIVGLLPVDSIYSPVLRVNYEVEQTRVKDITDYDKLSLEIWTNGVIMVEEAVSVAAKILIEHLNLFFGLSDMSETESVMIESNKPKTLRNLDISIDELELSVRSYNCLKRAGISTIRDLTSKTEDQMMKVRNLGRKSLDEVMEKLHAIGLNLEKSDDLHMLHSANYLLDDDDDF
ncbi:MAG: DNA-directed RNA polymerase subunit alpha [Clostridia bacterium]|nr:DNA-directed RNA polymerase subunit alpha [Clostridia bacterium]MBQ3093150.1 DNA-directed RNA polymerase subunit alpha [Clostridia bacterium]